MGDRPTMLGPRTGEATNYSPVTRILPGVVSSSPSSHVVDTYPAPSRFPNERLVPTVQQPPLNAPSTWTLGVTKGQDARTTTGLSSLRQGTLEGDDFGPEDPSPIGPKFGGNTLVGEPRPDGPGPSRLTSEPVPLVPVSAPTQEASPPKVEGTGKSSLFKRIIRKLEKFRRSKSVSTLWVRALLTIGRKNYLVGTIRVGAEVGAVDIDKALRGGPFGARS